MGIKQRRSVADNIADFDKKFPLLEDRHLMRMRLALMINFADAAHNTTGVNIHARDVNERILTGRDLTIHQIQMSLEGDTSEREEKLADGKMHYHNFAQKRGAAGYFSLPMLSDVKKNAKALFEEHDINLVHIRTPNTPVGVAVAQAAKEMDLPLVVTYHGGKRATIGKSLVEKVTLPIPRRLAGHRFGVSMDAMSAIGDATYIGNGIDMGFYDPDRKAESRLREDHPELKGKKLIFLPGRIAGIKGQMDLVKALGHLPKDMLDDVHVVLAGMEYQRDYMDKVMGQAKKLGVEGKVTHVGALDKNGMWAGYKEASIVCIPSREEPLGRVVLEGGAMRTPVIASEVGGIPEAMVNGKSGLLFQPADPRGIATAIVEVLSDPERAKAMGDVGRDYVGRFFDRDKLAERHMRVYSRLIKEHYEKASKSPHQRMDRGTVIGEAEGMGVFRVSP